MNINPHTPERLLKINLNNEQYAENLPGFRPTSILDLMKQPPPGTVLELGSCQDYDDTCTVTLLASIPQPRKVETVRTTEASKAQIDGSNWVRAQALPWLLKFKDLQSI